MENKKLFEPEEQNISPRNRKRKKGPKIPELQEYYRQRLREGNHDSITALSLGLAGADIDCVKPFFNNKSLYSLLVNWLPLSEWTIVEYLFSFIISKPDSIVAKASSFVIVWLNA